MQAEAKGTAAVGGLFSTGAGDGGLDDALGPGTVGRVMLIAWIVAALWLVLVWRVVEGY